MKEQKSDDLERMFREGLRDLKAEPDAAVWLAIQDAMKKRKRFWLFWSITGMVAIGLVATVLLQNQTMDHEPLTIAQQDEGDLETKRLGDGETVGQGENGDVNVRQTEQKEPALSLPKGSTSNNPEATHGSAPLTMTEDPNQEPNVRHPEQADGTSGEEEPSRRAEGPEPNVRHPEQTDGTSGEEETPHHLEGQDVFRHGSAPLTMTEDPEPETQNPKPRTLNPAPNTLMSLRIPFLYQEQLRDYPLLASTYQPKPKADSTKKVSPWSLAFNPGLLLPSVHSFGKTGTVNYEKTNESRPGVSMSLYMDYAFKQNWIMRSGIYWSSYSVSGNHRYFGYTDTVEWIDRDRNTGFQTVHKDRNWNFESRYQWIGIPIELGRRQNFNNGFGWEWTIGGGLNYLYSYDKIADGNKYLGGIDESIKRLQFNISVGFGAHYQWKGPWSTFVNVRYRLQPGYLYESELLREKHQILQFGIGLQYQFKWKGN